MTGRFASDLLPSTSANNDVGSTTNAWQAMYLDNGATDGGAVYFDAGTAEFIKSNAAGTQATIGGFSTWNFDSTVILGSGKASEGMVNVGMVPATTSETNDSIKIQGADGALSATNPNYVSVNADGTAGNVSVFRSTSDVTIDLTGAHWGAGTKGDLTDARLFVYAISNEGSLAWGISDDPNLESIHTSEGFTSQSSVDTSGYMLVNTALASTANWPCRRVGWFWASFDDTGGASEDLWALNGNRNEIYVGNAYNNVPISQFTRTTGNSFGSTDTLVRRLTTTAINTGTAIDHASSAANGDIWTINETGVYAIQAHDEKSTDNLVIAILRNGVALAQKIPGTEHQALDDRQVWSIATVKLNMGDRIRMYGNGTADDTTDVVSFNIIKLY